MKKQENLISQTAAANIAGVVRATISKMKKEENYNFFVGKKVNTNHPHWQAYLDERNIKPSKVQPAVENKPVSKSKPKPHKNKSKKKTVKKNSGKNGDKLLKEETTKQTNSLTGGYDPADMIPKTPSQLKALTDIQEKNINMRVRLDELIKVEMVVSILEVVIKDIKSFVSLGRKVSNLICQKLDCVGMEKQVEAVIDPEIESIIKMLKKNMERSINIESYK